jgi:hypothetical protein
LFCSFELLGPGNTEVNTLAESPEPCGNWLEAGIGLPNDSGDADGVLAVDTLGAGAETPYGATAGGSCASALSIAMIAMKQVVKANPQTPRLIRLLYTTHVARMDLLARLGR